jgi:hypothetical protein
MEDLIFPVKPVAADFYDIKIPAPPALSIWQMDWQLSLQL